MKIEFSDEGVPLFPERGEAVIDAFLATPAGQDAAHGADDSRRALTKAIVEQLEFEDPSAGFVTKSADPNRPQSKDAIGILAGGVLYAWDWQNGTDRGRQVKAGQPAEKIADQHPIPVGGVDHLKVGPGAQPQPNTPPATQDPPPTSPETNERIDRAIDLLGSIVTILGNQMGQLDDISRRLNAQGITLAKTSEDVSAALVIAQNIHETTTHQAGEAERASTTLHTTAVRVGEVANELAPLLRLLAAIRK